MPWIQHKVSRPAAPPSSCGLAACALLLLASSAAGCGSGSSPVVVRVGDAPIYRAEVDHWATAISRGNSVGAALGHPGGTPRQRALDLLISSSWILGEAAGQGLSVSVGAVERGIRERIDAEPNGRAEFDEELSSTGQTLADVKLEVKTALAAARLRETVLQRVPPVTGAQVASYYASHRQGFYIPDRRLVYLIEEIRSYGNAVALGKRLGPGARFVKRGIRELVRRETPAEIANRNNGDLVHMIFAATPGRVAGPASFNGGWVLGVVKGLVPAGVQPLSAVRGELSKSLTAERRQGALDRFAAEYASRWTARTWCIRGYVVQQCSQYRGVRKAEPNLLSGAER